MLKLIKVGFDLKKARVDFVSKKMISQKVIKELEEGWRPRDFIWCYV